MSPRVVVTVDTIRPRRGVAAVTKVATEVEGMVPNVTAIGLGLIDRRGSASATPKTTFRMATVAEDDPDPPAIDKSATSSLYHLDVLPPRQIPMGNTMVTVMDASPALETSMLKYMRVQHGKRQAS